ncbi:hypothetical protein ACFXD5_06725 [Streptomyces sp. NPDC059385]|uniref:hypothetical protein n=1 Tax=Streptomyces sp. NPDC059385 TaxID=3346817 RepID=UPI0036AFD6E8
MTHRTQHPQHANSPAEPQRATITRPQFEALRTAEPIAEWQDLPAEHPLACLKNRHAVTAPYNTINVLIRLGLVEKATAPEWGQQINALTPAGETIATSLEEGGPLVSLTDISHAVETVRSTAPASQQTAPAGVRTPARRQLDHALTALARTTPGRRRYIAEAATEYLDQIDGRRLPMGYDRPFPPALAAANRSDAFRMRRGDTVAAMLGLAVQPSDPNFPTTLRAIVTAVDTRVDRLVQAAHTTSAPAAIALAHILGGTR